MHLRFSPEPHLILTKDDWWHNIRGQEISSRFKLKKTISDDITKIAMCRHQIFICRVNSLAKFLSL